MNDLKSRYADKVADIRTVFSHVHRGDRIFVGTGCGEPQYLVNGLSSYVESNPSAFYDAEVFQVWTLGVAPYTEDKFKRNFRHNSFFIGNNTRQAVNTGMADYTPAFLSQLPDMIRKKLVTFDVALVQTSSPDRHGYMSLGVSVDITKTAVEYSAMVIAQVNPEMPRVHGEGFIHVDQVNYLVPCEEPLLEYANPADDQVVQKIGRYVARLVEDGDTIQVGYGAIPNAIIANLHQKSGLGVHTELVSDGIVELMKSGVIDNSRKTLHRGKTVGTFSMGKKETYEYLNDNPAIEFCTVDYTNNPLIISQNDHMTAINSALEIDLTGQATAESLGNMFFSGIGGHSDFMRGAVLARHGKTILALPSTADEDRASRIVPFIQAGAGVTLNRGDVQYVVTEYGIAYLQGKNIRERAMELIGIAHPKFRGNLIKEAKERHLIYRDQAYVPGKKGEYREQLETYRTTATGLEIFLRPVKISDEPLLKDFYYSLSDKSLYRRFLSMRKDMPHETLQQFAVVDNTQETVILAMVKEDERPMVAGIGQYGIDQVRHTAEAAFAVRDEFQGQGIGRELVTYLTLLAKRAGLLGFTAEVLMENKAMLHLFESMGFEITRRSEGGVYELTMRFRHG